ncbi:MAG: cysteine synthase family protein [Actinobacteria bacterium]|nr:cysteine synthase family protein [Actinomycetota bacterium]
MATLDAVLHAPTLTVPIDDDDGNVLWVKLEFQLPSGSTKDRIAARILLDAARTGQLTPASLVMEASSGSTSISLAMLCARLNVRFVAVMPEGVSRERLRIIERYGGAWTLTPAADGVPGSIAHVRRCLRDNDALVWPDQFANPLNVEAHASVTGPHLVRQVQDAGGRVDGFIAAVGTGGTLMGVGKAVRRAYPHASVGRVRVAGMAADAEQGGVPCGIPGVVDCLSELLDPAAVGLIDDIDVSFDEAMATTRELCARGFPVGPSSGLNVAGARRLARELGPASHVATVLCDRMERYFSTELFADLTAD